MSGATVTEFLAYWEAEGQAYALRGDYHWMASLVPGKRVLEIGCGPGFGTQALSERGLAVLSLDTLPACIAATRARVPDSVSFLQADVTALTPEQHQAIEAFAADCVVCWLMGAPADVTGAAPDGGQAVVHYRERLHRTVVDKASAMPTVKHIHLVDRTAIAWQAKDLGRDTLVGYHNGKTFHHSPFKGDRKSALYRKLDDNALAMAHLRKSHPAMKSVVPVLASLLAERIS